MILLGLALAAINSQRTKEVKLTNAAALATVQAQKKIDATNAELASLRAKMDSRKNEVDVRRTFLTKWGEVYTGAHKNIDNRIRKLVATRNVELIGVDQVDATIPLGDQQIKVRQYTRGFQGGYSPMLRFFGDFETSFELASIERVTFTKSMQQDLQMSLIFAIPNLTFDAAAPK
jgi:hypothetical protein